MLSGQCLCGEVEYELRTGLGPIVCCHCSLCRRATGAAFATNASVATSDFMIRRGADRITEYESSPGYFRTFSSRCGSPIYGLGESFPQIRRRVRLGTLDADPGTTPVAHVHVSSRATWFTLSDALEQFPGAPPLRFVAPPSVATEVQSVLQLGLRGGSRCE
jgi:hypothetical protein